ncbi:MAG: hypothetical protein JW885_03945 [Deltaproteobacteria bacterium]|nr:hypothetical protein [Candidatus Zymogenaceae bacterium]
MMDNNRNAFILTMLVCFFLVPFLYLWSSFDIPNKGPFAILFFPASGKLIHERGVLLALPILICTCFFAYRDSMRANLARIGVLCYYFHAVYAIIPRFPQILKFYEENPLLKLFKFSLPGILFLILILFALYYSIRSIPLDKISTDLFENVSKKSTTRLLIFGIVTFCLPMIIIFFCHVSDIESLLSLNNFVYHFVYLNVMHFAGRMALPFSFLSPEIRFGVVVPLLGIAAYLLSKNRVAGYLMTPILLVKEAIPFLTFFHPQYYMWFMRHSIFEMIQIIAAHLGIGKNKEIISSDAFLDYFTRFFSIDLGHLLFIIFTTCCFIYSILYLAKMKEIDTAK